LNWQPVAADGLGDGAAVAGAVAVARHD
jgi:hypothetical protein